jgi:hypothetical protein
MLNTRKIIEKMKNLVKNDYFHLALIVGVSSTIYFFYPAILNVALTIYAVVIIAFLVSGDFKSAWNYTKFLLLGLLIGVMLGIAHVDFFPWGIPLLILGSFILASVEADREPNEYVLKYITEMRSFGLPDQQITLNLQKAGWKTKNIHNAIKYLSKIYGHENISKI